MTTRFWSAVVPVVVALALPIAVDARPDGKDSKSDSKATAARSVAGVARAIGPTSITGTNAMVTRVTTIIGSAWTADNTPISQAHLRLRNVVSGRVEAATVADDAGQFSFTNVEGGSYVVELVNVAGKVQVMGHVFSIATGETVATFVRASTRVPWFTGFFSNTVSAVSSTAASDGITAIAPVARAVSPER